MRKLTFGVANSLDGFIARPDHAFDWILWCDEAKALSASAWKGVDTLLMGRKTYEIARAHAPKKKAKRKPKASPPRLRTYVFSRTLRPDPELDEGAEFVDGDAVAFVRDLKQSEGGDIILMGGGELARPLFEAGLIDELGLNVHPLLLGRGIPLFHGMERQVDLELERCERFSNGCVYLHYRVARGGRGEG